MAYRPTSLDFINRPNPVEPHTDPHKHPLHAEQNHLRLLHETTSNNAGTVVTAGEPPRKRRKSGDAPSHDIGRPTLPAVRQQGEKRLLIPPTLSGLHQPPPDSGILPSISANGLRSVELPERTVVPPQQHVETAKVPEAGQEPTSKSTFESAAVTATSPGSLAETAHAGSRDKPAKPRKNKKWTEPETKCLLKGVEKHGIGNWTKILKDNEFEFDERRNALDLKDRFRICCPDQYKTTRRPRSVGHLANGDGKEKPKRARTTHRKTQAELRELGIETDFAQSQRRKRTAYSEAEDQAILKGFRKYGQKWAQIQQDEDLRLEARTSMDLRDRMRTRWPEEYVKAGLKLMVDRDGDQKKQPGNKADGKKTSKGGQSSPSTTSDAKAGSSSKDSTVKADETAVSHPEKITKASNTTILPPKSIAAPFLSQADDVFWSQPLDTAEDEPITLDRRILDWPLDSVRATNPSTIDPKTTLNLPRPNALSTMQAAPPGSTAGILPSLAAVTAGSWPFDLGEQLELPSLLEGFGALDGDGEGEGTDLRGGGLMMPSLDEILG